MSHPTGAPAVLTALVVDDSAAARRRIATLLQLGGWRVHQAVGTDAALRVAAVIDPDLVVTEMSMRNGHGATLMRRLRQNGSRARFLVTTSPRTQQVRSLAASAGAVACLAKPVDPRLFVDVMRGLVPAVRPTPEVAPPVPQTGTDALERAAEMYASALPHRLASIATSAQEGDALAVASAAEILAEASDRAGHTEIAVVSHAIAENARRGIVAHARLMQLVSVCARVEGGGQLLAGQATPSA
jgi:CheY-like chemotaxis protein